MLGLFETVHLSPPLFCEGRADSRRFTGLGNGDILRRLGDAEDLEGRKITCHYFFSFRAPVFACLGFRFPRIVTVLVFQFPSVSVANATLKESTKKRKRRKEKKKKNATKE